MIECEDALTRIAKQAQEGDRKALEFLLTHPELKNLIYGITGRYLPPDDLDDAYHEVLLKVARHLDGWQQRAKITTWISKMTVNYCLTASAKERRIWLRISDISFSDGMPQDEMFPAIPPEQVIQVSERQLLAMIRDEFLPRMNARCQEILGLLLFEALEKEEIRQRIELKRSFFNQVWKECCEKLLKKIMHIFQN